jgi:ABC-type antimicrobial peptide transport system permease subunit
MILKQAAGMGAAGVVIGLAMNQALSGLLNGGSEPEPSNPWLLTLVPLLLLLTTLLAAAIPAQNAMRIDPQAALRDE